MNLGTQKFKLSPTPFLAPFLAYLLATLVMTWPLAAGLARDVPGDLGDSLLNMWILGWVAESVPRVATGAMSFREAWDANIFHPEPYALAFSEHLFGQALQILPIYHLTGNLILCYNLLFLSTFVLSGLGMYLLVRDITDDRRAAFLAGLIFAFVPYRVTQLAHIQTLSAQWMPLALFGLRRAIAPPSLAPNRVASYGAARGFKPAALAGGSAALLMQNWSCGYYLIYFTPFVAIFVLHQIVAAGRLRDLKLWLQLGIAAAVVVAGTWPFLTLYVDAQSVHALARGRAEVIGFGADVYGYLTAPEGLRLWGPILQMAPKPEGAVFLGFVPAALALVALVVTAAAVRRETIGEFFEVVSKPLRPMSIRRAAIAVLVVLALAFVAGLAGILFTGGFVTSLAGVPVRATNAGRTLWQLAGVVAALAIVSPHLRRALWRLFIHPAGLAATCLLLAAWLSLGPLPRSRGIGIAGLGLYGFFFDHVPGFDALRVPARYAMIAALYLSVLAGIGASWVIRRPRGATPVTVALCAAFLIEAAFAPMPVNAIWAEDSVVPAARVEPAATAPPVYRQLAGMPGNIVVAEFPFGDAAWELRYVYYSTVHWKRIINGYSGQFPLGYRGRAARFRRVADAPHDAWQMLVDAGATHVIVHESGFPPGEAQIVKTWLENNGARAIGRFDSDVLYDFAHAR